MGRFGLRARSRAAYRTRGPLARRPITVTSVRHHESDGVAARPASELSGPPSLGLAGRLVLLATLVVGVLLSLGDPFTLLFYGSYAAMGALLLVRRPGNAIGRLMLAIAFGFIGTTTTQTYPVEPLADGSAPLDAFVWVWVGSWAGYATFTGLITLSILFPSGHLPRDRSRRPAIVLIALGMIVSAVTAIAPQVGYNPDSSATTVLVPNQFALFPDSDLWTLVPIDLLVLPVAALLAFGVVGMVARYRRSSGVQRLQLRWLVAAMSLVLIGVIAGLSTSVVLGDNGGLAWLGTIVGLPDGACIHLRRRHPIPPVRDRPDHLVVDRRFNRSRYDAERALVDFGRRLRDEVDLAAVTRGLTTSASEAVRPAGIGIWLRAGRDLP